MKVQVTKTMLDELYNSTLNIKEIAESLSETLGTKITPIRASELFNSQGYNMRTRKRGSSIEFEVIDMDAIMAESNALEEYQLAEEQLERYSI